jgi:hypothetical protein
MEDRGSCARELCVRALSRYRVWALRVGALNDLQLATFRLADRKDVTDVKDLTDLIGVSDVLT